MVVYTCKKCREYIYLTSHAFWNINDVGMTDIFIDATTKPNSRYIAHRCFYCDLGKYPNGKVIGPTNDKDAHKTSRGDWKCGTRVHSGHFFVALDASSTPVAESQPIPSLYPNTMCSLRCKNTYYSCKDDSVYKMPTKTYKCW